MAMEAWDFEGRWVVPNRGRQQGMAGRVTGHTRFIWVRGSPLKIMEVQFGADGPFRWYRPRSLRLAKDHEIPEGLG